MWELTGEKCVDIIFALPENVNPVNETNYFNSTDISFKDPFSNAATTTTSTPAGASRTGLVREGLLKTINGRFSRLVLIASNPESQV
jgi:hypothetical protein